TAGAFAFGGAGPPPPGEGAADLVRSHRRRPARCAGGPRPVAAAPARCAGGPRPVAAAARPGAPAGLDPSPPPPGQVRRRASPRCRRRPARCAGGPRLVAVAARRGAPLDLALGDVAGGVLGRLGCLVAGALGGLALGSLLDPGLDPALDPVDHRRRRVGDVLEHLAGALAGRLLLDALAQVLGLLARPD